MVSFLVNIYVGTSLLYSNLYGNKITKIERRYYEENLRTAVAKFSKNTSSKKCTAVTNHRSIQKKINEYTGDSYEKTNLAYVNASDRSSKEFNVAWKLMITTQPTGRIVRPLIYYT